MELLLLFWIRVTEQKMVNLQKFIQKLQIVVIIAFIQSS